MIGIVPKIKIQHIPISPSRRPGTKGKKDSVTVHNTANPTSKAQGERNWLTNPANTRTASWHYVVDDTEAILAIPEDEVAWHAGNATGNRTSVGVEVCESGDQKKTWSHAVGLTAKILMDNGLGADDIRTHEFWSGKKCPRLILPRWNEFVRDVRETIEHLKAPAAASNSSTIQVSIDKGAVENFNGLLQEGRSYVALRDILERLGFSVGWDQARRVVTVDRR